MTSRILSNRTRARRALAWVLAIGIAGCTSATSPSRAVSIRATSASFVRTAQGGAEVSYVIANDGTTPVRLTESCDIDPSPTVERRAGNGWTPHAGGRCLAIHVRGFLVIEPGTTRQAVVGVAEAGAYRLVLDTDRGAVVSSSFTVR